MIALEGGGVADGHGQGLSAGDLEIAPPGDDVEVEIQGLGVLRNSVVAEGE